MQPHFYRALFILITIFPPILSYGDNSGFNPRDYSIVPPAPEVASLLDFKDYPVDYFHGIPSISFPLYTLRNGAIEIPISVSYQGGGIRAEQKVGNAGLGWSVMCGGTISHTVYGAPDDANLNNRVHGLYHLNADETSFRQNLIDKEADYDPTDMASYSKLRSWQSTLGNNYFCGKTDVANDLYNLLSFNMSATFARDKNGNVTLSSANPLKITNTENIPHITDGGCDGWCFLVTDDKGIKYEFLTQDRTRYEFHQGSPMLDQTVDSIYYASSWHLDRITDLTGNTITFKYKKTSGRVTKDIGHAVSRGYTNPSALNNPSHISSVSSIIYYPQVITEIAAAGIKIKFSYLNEENSISDARIKTIEIEAPSEKKRIYTFNYENNLLISINDGNQTIYSFEYNLDYGDELYKYYQDFGGYTNDNSSGSLIPNAILGNQQVGHGADRSVSNEYAQTLVLTKITYPTGGCTEFEWESNTFRYLNSNTFRGMINENNFTVTTDVDTLRNCHEKGYSKLLLTKYEISENQDVTLDLTKYFLMNPANLYNTAYYDEHYAEYSPVYPHIAIKKTGANNVLKKIYLDRKTIEIDGNNEPIALNLEAGYYDFELLYPDAVQGAEDFLAKEFMYHDCIAGYIYISKLTSDRTGNGREYWCGLRIKKIKSITGNPEDEPLIKHFFYNISRDPHSTTGTVQMLPKYDYMYYMVYPHPGLLGYAETEVYCMGEPAFPNSTEGHLSNIEYPQVMVFMGNEDPMEPHSYLNTMAETFTYSSARSMANCDYNYSKFLAFQPIGSQMYTSRAHRRGILEKHNVISASLPVRSTEYSYNIYESNDCLQLTTDAFVICDFLRVPSIQAYDYGIGTYSLIPYNKTINCIRTIDENGIDSYKTFEYFYDSYTDKMDYGLIKSTKETDKSGLETQIYYTYAGSSKCKLPYPETEITTYNGRIISAERTEYDPTTWLPIRKYQLSSYSDIANLITDDGITTKALKDIINTPTFSYKYNSYGNLVEISYKDVVLVSYLWGYNGLYPIIEGIGIDYESLVGAASKTGLTIDQINCREISDDAKISSVAKSLRNEFKDKTISAISFDWFYGVLRFTDGRGIDTNYTYDGQGRLTSIKDFNDYIISKFRYHYVSDSQ